MLRLASAGRAVVARAPTGELSPERGVLKEKEEKEEEEDEGGETGRREGEKEAHKVQLGGTMMK